MDKQKSITIKERMQILGSGTVISLSLEVLCALFAHSNPTLELASLAPMVWTAIQGNTVHGMIEQMRLSLGPNVDREQFDKLAEAIVQNENTHLDQSLKAKGKRILDAFTFGKSEEVESAQPKDERNEGVPLRKRTKDNFEYNTTENGIPKKFMLDTVLDKMLHYNSKGKLYFGTLSNGEDLALPIYTVYHILYIAKSGKGKSNDYRLLMMQAVEFAETYYINPLANNVKRLVDHNDPREIEVWKPIFDRLENKHPVREAKEMIQLLQHLLNIIKERQMNEESEDEWPPVFLFVDELPECKVRCEEAGYKGRKKDLFTECLDRLVRTGRQFGVFVCATAQDASVTSIGLSEASQGQFSTLLYGGGDKRGAVKMFGEISVETETMMKTKPGLKLVLANNFSNTEFLQTPLTTNEALFEYYGLGEFDLEYWKHWKNGAISFSNSISNFNDDEENDPEITQDTFEEEIEIENTWDEEIIQVRNEQYTKGQLYVKIWDAISEVQQDERRALTINAIITKAGLTNSQIPLVVEIAKELQIEIEKSTKGRKAAAK